METVLRMIDVLNCDRYMAHNLTNLDTTQENPKLTIEFRQHAGTLDEKKITMWIGFVISLVEFAVEAGQREALYQHVIQALRTDLQYQTSNSVIERSMSLEDIFRYIEVPEAKISEWMLVVEANSKPSWKQSAANDCEWAPSYSDMYATGFTPPPIPVDNQEGFSPLQPIVIPSDEENAEMGGVRLFDFV